MSDLIFERDLKDVLSEVIYEIMKCKKFSGQYVPLLQFLIHLRSFE